jgi:hypothetical protein
MAMRLKTLNTRSGSLLQRLGYHFAAENVRPVTSPDGQHMVMVRQRRLPSGEARLGAGRKPHLKIRTGKLTPVPFTPICSSQGSRSDLCFGALECLYGVFAST